MNQREAMKETLRFLFYWLEEDKDLKFNEKEQENAIEIMHDNDDFLESIINSFYDHVIEFGENYGLTIPYID